MNRRFNLNESSWIGNLWAVIRIQWNMPVFPGYKKKHLISNTFKTFSLVLNFKQVFWWENVTGSRVAYRLCHPVVISLSLSLDISQPVGSVTPCRLSHSELRQDFMWVSTQALWSQGWTPLLDICIIYCTLKLAPIRIDEIINNSTNYCPIYHVPYL